MREKLVLVLVGLPARGKSTLGRKIAHTLEDDGVWARIFNNGELRRQRFGGESSRPDFFSFDASEAVRLREELAEENFRRAREYLATDGDVAILDATNATRARRRRIEQRFDDYPILYVECANVDMEVLEANVERKAELSEFKHLEFNQILESLQERILAYEKVYEPLDKERNFIVIDSFENWILREQSKDVVPFHDRVRDILTTRIVKSLFLIRHGQTAYNLENRVGGDSDLTAVGTSQATALARHFSGRRIPTIFTSSMRRTRRTAEIIAKQQRAASIIALTEFNEINAGRCEDMSYEEISEGMPEVARARNRDKYGYVYPGGEGYVSMEARIRRGLQKVFYLSEYDDEIMIVGHQAVNRMILSRFLFRDRQDVPFIYIPQNRYYHIEVTAYKKLFELVAFDREGGPASARPTP